MEEVKTFFYLQVKKKKLSTSGDFALAEKEKKTWHPMEFHTVKIKMKKKRPTFNTIEAI